ncbi:MAG: hypothetical protein ABID04_02475 [Patescibacteria group bacterium]
MEKEHLPTSEIEPGTPDLVQSVEKFKVPKKVEGWLERLEKGDVYLSKPVIDDQTGQVLVTAPSAKKVKIVLPLDKQKLIYGLGQKATEAIRWLAEWCLRLIKMKPKQVEFKENS